MIYASCEGVIAACTGPVAFNKGSRSLAVCNVAGVCCAAHNEACICLNPLPYCVASRTAAHLGVPIAPETTLAPRSSAAEPAYDAPAESNHWGTGAGSQRSNMAAVLHGINDLRFEQAPPLPDRCGGSRGCGRCGGCAHWHFCRNASLSTNGDGSTVLVCTNSAGLKTPHAVCRPAPGTARIAIKAVGICRSDVHYLERVRCVMPNTSLH